MTGKLLTLEGEESDKMVRDFLQLISLFQDLHKMPDNLIVGLLSGAIAKWHFKRDNNDKLLHDLIDSHRADFMQHIKGMN